jgi:predicted amidohydrolase YtcJ
MKQLAIFTLALFTIGCSQKEDMENIYFNTNVYTVNSEFSVQEAFVVKDGKIVDVGSNDEILSKYSSENKVDLEGKFVYPGFIDPHCHFYGYGLSLQWANLRGTQSFEEILEIIKTHYENSTSEWILGRGWDQNDWENKDFPSKEKLDVLFPNNPVYLVRVDGHAALVNSKALEIANFNENTFFEGGHLQKKDGKLTGILIDNAKEELYKIIPEETIEQQANSLLEAAKDCFAVGLTSVADAGLKKETIGIMDSLQQNGDLKMRIYAMVESSDEASLELIRKGIYRTDYLSVRSVKMYADGALGSRGALMLEDYSDDPGNKGILVNTQEYYDNICKLAYENNFQVCTHAIGDGANRIILNTYAKFLKGKNDLRWRIEHAQVVNPDDFELFGKFNIVPSMQSTHATSDMYWAEDRVGSERIKGAYALKQLMNQNGWIPNGSDFPVEKINPLLGYYAAISRKDIKGYPEEGFQKENALSREEAMRAMTIWAAKSCFQEDEKGSIEKGKFADFVILEEDLLNIEESKIPNIKVLETYINGHKVY